MNITALKLIAIFLINAFSKRQFPATPPQQVKALVDKLITLLIEVDEAEERHDQYGCISTWQDGAFVIEALIDCYVVDMAYINFSMGSHTMRFSYTNTDQISASVTINGQEIVSK